MAANQQPDFLTICRAQILRVCHASGLVKLGVVALDGAQVAAQAALTSPRRQAWPYRRTSLH